MQGILIYGVTVAAIFTALLGRSIIDLIRRFSSAPTTATFCLRHLYPLILRQNALTADVTRLSALLQLLYWGGTSLFNTIGVRSLQEGSSRAISIASLNIIPLLLGARLADTAAMLNVPVHAWRTAHASVGLMTVVQTAVHVGLRARDVGFNVHTRDVYAVMALGALGVSLLSFLPFIRRHAFEFSKLTHLPLAATVVFSLWCRLGGRITLLHLFLAAGSACYFLSYLYRAVRTAWRNLSISRGCSKATITKFEGASRISIQLVRPLQMNPGQFIYFWTAQVGVYSSLQSHPFAIAWWSNDRDGKVTRLSLLIESRRGITKRLMDIADGTSFKVAVDGPFGSSVETSTYGSLILFASGIGIAGVVPFLRRAVTDYYNGLNSLHRISVVWQMGREFEEDWVQDWMQELLEADKDKMLQIHQYVSQLDDPESITHKDTSYGKRVRKTYEVMDVTTVVNHEIQNAIGTIPMLVSCEAHFRHKIRSMSRTFDTRKISYKELDFQPE